MGLAAVLLAFIGLPFWASSRAAAQTAGEGIAVAGDFRGNGRTQIASLYDGWDDLGLRIDLLDGTALGTFSSSTWYAGPPGTWDVTRMKVAAIDVDSDGRMDIVVLYQVGDTTTRLYVLRSTGASFTWDGRAWWAHDGYDWDRIEEVLAGHFSAVGRAGLILAYQYDNYQLRMHYLESLGDRFVYTGNGGVYDSGPGQYDATRAQFAVGHFTRSLGPDQIASVYQYPNARIRVHVFDPTSAGLQPVNGWGGLYDSGEGQYELDSAKIVAARLGAEGRTDLLALYGYPDGSLRVHQFSAARNLALTSTSGLAYLPAGTLAFGPSRLLAGDWYGDGRSSLAVLTPFSNGSTEASVFRNRSNTLAYAPTAYVTPWYEQRTPSSPVGLAMSADFCVTHYCIPNFPNGRGYVVMCADGGFSGSGGIQGACSTYHVANGGTLDSYSRSTTRANHSGSSYGLRTQYVSGYYRKNGTYVAPYFRSPPRSTFGGSRGGRRR